MAATLREIDPAEAWKPAPKAVWNHKWAAHLFRRAAFGVPAIGVFATRTSWESLDQAVEAGREACIDLLMDGGPGTAYFDELADEDGDSLMRSDAKLFDLQGYWLNRLQFTPHPLQERMTLFWHNHFATSIVKVVKPQLMLKQQMLLRKHALGSFREMLVGIGRDSAMLIWLDANDNVKDAPNENYAREVMELFSLGEGSYTEQDIREAARAFSGWGTKRDEFAFTTTKHDDTEKTVLGQKGKWNGDDVARILLDQPAAAKHLVRKLFREFVSELESPPDDLIEPLAKQLRDSDYDMKPLMRTMLSSRLFFSAAAYRRRVKSPVEYVLGLLNSFYGVLSSVTIAELMDGLGQSLFAPPNVKGWDGGKTWLNSSTLLARHNLAWQLVGGEDGRFSRRMDPAALVRQAKRTTQEEQVAFLLELLLQGEVDELVQGKLVAFLGDGPENEYNQRLREVTHTILLLPRYQLA